MRAYALDPEEVTAERITGAVLCQDVVAADSEGRVRLAKGRVLTESDAEALRNGGRELHLLALEPGDVHEDEASRRLAAAIAGDGLSLRPPVESQTHLRATRKGLVQVKVESLTRINALPDMSVYTLYDGQPVTSGKAVAATKVTPLAVPAELVEAAEALARESFPVVQVSGFSGGGVGVVVRERLADRARARFETAIHMKIGWFGSPVRGIRYCPEDRDAIASAIRGFLDEDVVLVLAAGVNSTDPLDLTIQALESIGAVTEKRGVPAHPGSTCWLSYAGEIPIFGLALCGMFSRTTVLDLLLPRFLSGQQVRATDLARLGHGGMLGKEMAFRFPMYTDSETETP